MNILELAPHLTHHEWMVLNQCLTCPLWNNPELGYTRADLSKSQMMLIDRKHFIKGLKQRMTFDPKNEPIEIELLKKLMAKPKKPLKDKINCGKGAAPKVSFHCLHRGRS